MASLISTQLNPNQMKRKQFHAKDPEKDHFKLRTVDLGCLACFLKQACSLFLKNTKHERAQDRATE